MQGVDIFSRLSQPPSKTNLSKFKEVFYERWESREIPLALALDAECGIGYPQQTSSEKNDISPLVDDLSLPFEMPDVQQMEFSGKLFHFWLSKYNEVKEHKLYEINLTEKDIADFKTQADRLPNTFAVMLSIVGNEKVFLKSVGGSSSSNLLGRFCHDDPSIHAFSNEMIAKEREFYKDKIVAEIVHLPESRTGNILFRPVLREYEIPYLSRSSVAEAFQLPVEDLMVSLRDNRVYLRSKRHNKEVVPRLTTAHNYSYKSLPLYYFLADLQTQDHIGGFEFDPGLLFSNSRFIPRITYKDNLILHPGKWQLRKSDFKHLAGLKGQELFAAFAEFRLTWKMPAFVAVSEGDNELVIDTNNESSILLLMDELKGKESVTLVEFFVEDKSPIESPRGSHANEILLAFYKDQPIGNTAAALPSAEVQQDSITRTFAPGDEWLYFKIYTGYKTGDDILGNVIKSLSEELIESNLVEKWFFIRYADPKFHVRLRFLLADKRWCGEVILRVNEALKPYRESGAVWNVQLDTYNREIERYGEHLIEHSETIFYRDSEAIASILSLIEGEEGEYIKWLSAMKGIDYYLDLFAFTQEEKRALIDTLRGNFETEFGAGKDFRSQLDKKFRKNKETIDRWLVPSLENMEALKEEYEPILEILDKRNKDLEPVAKEIMAVANRDEIMQLLASYLHMNINRLFRSKNRLHEFVVFDLVERAYRYQIGKAKALSKKNSLIVS